MHLMHYSVGSFYAQGMNIYNEYMFIYYFQLSYLDLLKWHDNIPTAHAIPKIMIIILLS